MTEARARLKAMKLQREKLQPIIAELVHKRHQEAKQLIKQDIEKLKQELMDNDDWNPFK